jgi:hypothetical protein
MKFGLMLGQLSLQLTSDRFSADLFMRNLPARLPALRNQLIGTRGQVAATTRPSVWKLAIADC